MTGQARLSLKNAGKDGVRLQFAALCWRRRRGKLQVLLVTSRRAKRWILPKGWPIDGKTPMQCAEVEAWEEAGARGRVRSEALGVYAYDKRGARGPLPCLAMVYPIEVAALAKHYPEKAQRRRRWVSRKKAARMVAGKDLARLIAGFQPTGGSA